MADDIRLNPDLNLKGQKAIIKKKATEELWRRGEVREFLLDLTQQSIARDIDKSAGRHHVVMCSRRLGKSHMLSTLCIEKALKKPNQLVKFITGSQRAARDIVLPIFRRLIETCPEDIRPEWRVHENRFKFENGSEIALYGVDATGGDDLRGQAADFYVVDEAGFIPKLDILVKEILAPMIIERGGRGVLSSTPPRHQGHPFISYVAEAERKKTLTVKTIDDCPRFSKKQIEAFEEEAGGRDTDVFRREYLCQMIFLSEDAVIPEFTSELAKELTYSGKQALNYVPDRYVSLDPGFADKSGILFAYYNFTEAILYVEREYAAKGNSTQELADAIKKTEKELWNGMAPTKRISDIDLRLIKDLRDLHNLRFHVTEKDNKDAQINNLRILLQQKKIKIHESCVNLRSQLLFGQWKTSASGKRDYQRSVELGHLDLLDALIYLVRNVNFKRNPISDPAVDPHSYWYNPQDIKKSKLAKALAKAFR